ncbi:cytochrome c-type biogenesis protein [Luteimonas flava]|uniref:cytochrome c-type biogenesis protein n=1 Tax=Luteimonas flava TaxID=3115822 RepID=UPI003CCE0FB2
MIRAALLALLLCLTWPQAARAQVAVDAAPLRFEDTAEERRFHSLVAELRCVMCQNQSLADSNAQIAHDLRREVLTLMREGLDDPAIKAHLVARYGEFVLYRPQVGPSTWLLWFGPLLLLGAGGVVIWRVVASRKEAAPLPPDDTETW